MKTLDAKLAAIHADPVGALDFILADAKDADMAFGLAATGVDPATGQPRSLADYRDQMREVVRQGLVDIMLMSASTNDVLTFREGPPRVYQLTAPAGMTPAPAGPGFGGFTGPPATMAESSLPQAPRRITLPPTSMTVYEFDVR